jgi:hypothetical protein
MREYILWRNLYNIISFQDYYIREILSFMHSQYQKILKIYHMSDFGSIYKDVPKELRIEFWFAVIKNDKHYQSLQDNNIFKCFAHSKDMKYVEEYRKAINDVLSAHIYPDILNNIIMEYV